MAHRQINVRLDESTWEVLDLLAFLEGKPIVELVRPEIEALANRRSDEPGLQSARRSRKEHQAFLDSGDAPASSTEAEHRTK